MESIAVISDVHANILGLDAVLKDAENQGADNLVFLGDLVMAGPRPREALARLTGVAPSVWIKGNTDDWLSEVDKEFVPSSPAEERIKAMTLWSDARLQEQDCRAMLSRPIVQTAEYSGVKLVFCHGTPDSYSKGILEDISQTELAALKLHPYLESGGILICGHTHRRFFMRWGNLDIINFGAVSIPGDCLSRNARYGIIEIDQGRIVYRPREVEFDFSTYVQEMINEDLPGRAELLVKYGLE